MNILITSAGTRGYLIRYFKKALKKVGKIFAADCSKYAPALYNADNYFIVPAVADKNYISELFKICLKNKVKGVISLNDIELPVLAQYKSKFIENKLNKLHLIKALPRHYPYIPHLYLHIHPIYSTTHFIPSIPSSS